MVGCRLLIGLAVLAGALGSTPPAQAGPVLCTTSIEAPAPAVSASGAFSSGPVEVTRCGPVTSTAELMQQRFYSYTAPYARGVGVMHQVTDPLGIAVGGSDGTRLMGFGFPDQTVVWDGSAMGNTYQVLLEQQSRPMPWRTSDLNNGFCQGLPPGGCTAGTDAAGVRGLW